MVLGTARFRLGPALTLGAAAGAILGGHVDAGPRRFEVTPGAHLSAQLTWTPLRAPGSPLTVGLTGAVAVGLSGTRDRDTGATAAFTAVDVRVGVTASRTIAEVLTPYLAARAFGGPVFWDAGAGDVVGSDTKHVQLVVGASVEPYPRLYLRRASSWSRPPPASSPPAVVVDARRTYGCASALLLGRRRGCSTATGLQPLARLHLGVEWAFFGETGVMASLGWDL
ncbi:MAG: hypothetical protein R3B82_24585 [Sandaracinaceae bacterium]